MKPQVTEKMIQLYVLGVAPQWVLDAIGSEASESPEIGGWISKWQSIASECLADDVQEFQKLQPDTELEDRLLQELQDESLKFQKQLDDLKPDILPWPTSAAFSKTALLSTHAADSGSEKREALRLEFVIDDGSTETLARLLLTIPANSIQLKKLPQSGEDCCVLEVTKGRVTEPVALLSDNGQCSLARWEGSRTKKQAFLVPVDDLLRLLGTTYQNRLVLVDGDRIHAVAVNANE